MHKKNTIKIACLIFFMVGLLIALLTGNPMVKTAHAFAEGPNAGHSGAPGELTCAVSDCHGGQPNTGVGQLQILGPSVYEPGKTYEITVKHMTTDNGRRRWGFQLTALDRTNNKAGELQNSGSLTQILSGGPGGERQYVEHSFLGTFQGQRFQASWIFNWTAPSSDVGPVILYVAGNQANNDGNNTGDQIYTTNATISSTGAVTGSPVIDSATVTGKSLFVMGGNFAIGATLFMDGARQKKTFNDEITPNTLMFAKKSGKNIARGQTVVLQVRNPDGSLSNEFQFTRPL